MHWWTVQQLRSKKPMTRLQAVAKLAAEGTAHAVDLLQGLIASDPDRNVRKSALQAVAGLKNERSIEMVLKGLRDLDAEVRETTARLLGQLGATQAVPPLVAALQDANGAVRRQAALALDTLGWQSDSDTQWLQRSVALGEFHKLSSQGAAAVEPLITALKDPQNPKRRLALEALSQTGDARAVKPIISALKEDDAHVRVAAVEALARMRESSATEALMQCLRDKDNQVRTAVAAALGKIGAALAVPALLAALKDDQWSVRQAAAESLGRLKAESAVEPLLPLLKDRDKDVRCTVAQALAGLADPRSVRALIEALVDSQTEVRRAAIAALQKTRPDWARTDAARQAIPALKAAQQHREYWVRQAATETLARINELPAAQPEPSTVADTMHFRRKTATEMLIELLADYDRDLRLAAVEGLGRLGDSRAVTPLVATLRDDDVWVREAAIQSLNRLGWSPGNSGAA
jgi:HEAT repeat protein